MIRSKAVNIIKSLSKPELLKLGKFISSPYFNSNKKLMQLYEFTKKFYPGFSSPEFTKEQAFKSIYKNEKYNDEKLRKLLSDMRKELEKFLVLLRLEGDKPSYNKLLLRMLDLKKLDNLFYSTFTLAQNFLDEQDFEYDYFLEKFLLQWHYVSFHLDRGEQQKIALNIYERGSHAVLFFLSDLFLTLNDINANRSTFGFNYEPSLPEHFFAAFDAKPFFDYVDKNDIKHKEIVKIYYYAYLANKNFEEEKYFHELENFVFNKWNEFSNLGKLTSVSYLMNYCSRKIAKGNEQFAVKLNNVYRVILKNRLFLREKGVYVRSDIFLKILDNFFHNGKIEEAEKELIKNIEFLHPEQRNGILCYSRALIKFTEKKYEESLRELSLIKTNSALFVNRLKILQIKAYYELGLFDEAVELANNYRTFIHHYKTISETARSSCMNFLNIYKEMLKIKRNNTEKYSILGLSKLIAENFPVEKQWLQEKINIIESSIRNVND